MKMSKKQKLLEIIKARLKKESSQLVSRANQLKLKAADGKKYLTDTYSDETIDGKSKSKAFKTRKYYDIRTASAVFRW